MFQAAITGSGVFTPTDVVTNQDLVVAFNAYAVLQNEKNAMAIASGEMAPVPQTSTRFIQISSGIRQRFVMDRKGVLDPERMHPTLPERADHMPGLMAEMAMDACASALAQANCDAQDIELIICAASNHERAYPAVAIEIQGLLGARGFAFDMNVACSSATFGLQAASDMIRSGSIKRALVVSPEICSAHTDWRDPDCNFIFGDVCTAIVLERANLATVPCFLVHSTSCATAFSNNIRNNNGFLRSTRKGHLAERRDMLFRQNGREVFKEVLPMVVSHIRSHLSDAVVETESLKRLWLHQANKTMNDFIGKKVLERKPEASEQPNILQTYGNTSSAGAIVAFSQHSDDFAPGEIGLICSFGAGYSIGSVLLEHSNGS